ncbi:2Fe-2S iron-sulfur cluster-binding protein [Chitinimonas sp.]|uniref:2Fe-2S iron-sulfur cluster-binding protein n=1 Tax=Chitinimonas sp. TaxID=1934313 RepID=UPI0035AE6B79
MSTVQLSLLGGKMATAIELELPAGGKLIDAVRDLARDGQLPLYWRCGQGTCGACLVYLNHAESGQRSVSLTAKERNVLLRIGQLDGDKATLVYPDSPTLPRLACHVLLEPGWLAVSW